MTTFAVTTPAPIPQPSLRRQKGYSIVELSIALAIISIILVTALAGVQRILRSNNTNEDLRNLNLLASKLTVMLTNVTNTAGKQHLSHGPHTAPLVQKDSLTGGCWWAGQCM